MLKGQSLLEQDESCGYVGKNSQALLGIKKPDRILESCPACWNSFLCSALAEGLGVVRLAGLFHEFAAKSLVLPVKDGGGLFVVLPLFPFADNSLFFDHALEALDCFFEVFGVVNNDVCHK